jgi:hypothetical protein
VKNSHRCTIVTTSKSGSSSSRTGGRRRGPRTQEPDALPHHGVAGRGQAVFGLPGNPVSSIVSFESRDPMRGSAW